MQWGRASESAKARLPQAVTQGCELAARQRTVNGKLRIDWTVFLKEWLRRVRGVRAGKSRFGVLSELHEFFGVQKGDEKVDYRRFENIRDESPRKPKRGGKNTCSKAW